MKKITMIFMMSIFIIGCSNQRVSGIYRKQFETVSETSFPQAMEYVIKEDRILTLTTISYSENKQDAELMGDIQLQNLIKEFGETAVSTNTTFDVNEQYYKNIVVVDYSKINKEVLKKYITEKNESEESALTVSGIYDFASYEKIGN